MTCLIYSSTVLPVLYSAALGHTCACIIIGTGTLRVPGQLHGQVSVESRVLHWRTICQAADHETVDHERGTGNGNLTLIHTAKINLSLLS